MTLKGYAKTVKVNGSKVTLPIAGHSVTIEVTGSKSKRVKVAGVVITAVLAIVGIY